MSRIASRVAQRYLEKLAWQYVGDMTRERALKLLGFDPKDTPSAEEITKNWRQKALENHPDKGGSHEALVAINMAKDYLLKAGASAPRSEWRPERSPTPDRPKREPPPVVDTIKGKNFAEGVHHPSGVEWLFISKPEWMSYKERGWSADMWVVFGRIENKLIAEGVRHRGANTVFDADKSGNVIIESDWLGHFTEGPLKSDLTKLCPKLVREVMEFGDGGTVRKAPQKYIAWPGGELNESTVLSVKMGSGGASLKDILISSGLVSKDHPSMSGRKTNVEVTPVYNLAMARELKKERAAQGKQMFGYEYFDYYVSVDGKAGVKLAAATVENLKKNGFVLAVFSYDPNDKVPKNLTKMRGGHLGAHGGVAIKLLLDALTTEPASLHEELKEALSQWGDPSKF
jgi:hypothetical protein